MKRPTWIRLFALALALILLVGSIANIAAPAAIRADYARWGYPEGFYYLTGILELVAAVLLAWQQTRQLGVVLGLCLMGAAFLTHFLNAEFIESIAPAVAFALLLALGLIMNRYAKSSRSADTLDRIP